MAKRSSLRVRKNTGDRALRKIGSSEGRLFQVERPTMGKAWLCLDEVWVKGTRRKPCWDEQNDRELRALSSGQQRSGR